MAKSNKFYGKINDKSIYEVIGRLDYKEKDFDKRLEYVNDIVNNNEDWFKTFNDDFYKSDLKCMTFGEINSADPLWEDSNVAQALERLANYLIYCPSIKKQYNDDKKKSEDSRSGKYTVLQEHTENDYENKQLLWEGFYDSQSFMIGEADDFNGNFKLEKKQKIYKSRHKEIVNLNGDVKYIDSDLERCDEIKEYQNSIDIIDELRKQYKEQKRFKEIEALNEIKGDLKYSQLLIKDATFGTIYFKSPLRDSIDLNENYIIDFYGDDSINTIVEMLKMNPRGSNHWLGDSFEVLEYYIDCIWDNLSMNQQQLIFDLRQHEGYNWKEWKRQEPIEESDKIRYGMNKLELPRYFGYSKPYIEAMLKDIAKMIKNLYVKDYEDMYYLMSVKRKWKRCPKCGETKAYEQFGKDSSKNDGLRNYCKSCVSK